MKVKIFRKKNVKIAVAAILLLAVGFGIVNLLWFRYIRVNFGPFLKSEKLEQVFVSEPSPDGTVYLYQDHEGKYEYQITKPPYLRFWGSMEISTKMEMGTDGYFPIYLSDYRICLYIDPTVPKYSLSIFDHYIRNNVQAGRLDVDKNGTPLAPSHDPPFTEHYEKGLVLYDKFNEPIMELFENLKEIYGEEGFQ